MVAPHGSCLGHFLDLASMEWDDHSVVDLNDIAVFGRVATFQSFSLAARTLGLPKSSISRAIARLEHDLGVRLFQRGTRTVRLTPVGAALRDRCAGALAQLGEAVDFAAGIAGAPRGGLRISAGIGFGVNVMSQQLPGFLARYPEVHVSLDLSSREADLVAEGVDVAIRMGALSDSALVATRLGRIDRHLCAAPSYFERRGWPQALADLARHDTVDMPGSDGRPRAWSFARGGETERIEVAPRVSVNDALTITRLVSAGVGLGLLSGYLCAPALATGELVRLFPDWRPTPVEVSLVFPSRREMSPVVRAFVDYMREQNRPDAFWMDEGR